MWWVRDPDRLKREITAIEELRDSVQWLTGATPRLRKGLKLAFDFEIRINGAISPLCLEYPAFFPDTPPLVIPREPERLSSHQYGDGGELCLEFRSDNWDPAITGAMMIESAYRLISGERPTADQRGVVPTAHHVSLGQQLRGATCRFLLTEAFVEHARRLPIGCYRLASVIEVVTHNRSWSAYVDSIEGGEEPGWKESDIPDRGNKGWPALILKCADIGQVPAQMDQDGLDDFLAGAGVEPHELQVATGGARFSILVDDHSARVFFSIAREAGATIIPYRTIDLSGDTTSRLPDSYAALAQKRVGIVGCGSLGSKIAASLARSGVGVFTLVDDDILKLGNLVRHELDVGGLGAHKVDGLEARLKAIRSGIEVSPRRILLGGQESSGTTASVVEELSTCDLLIDATADPQAFNFTASAARRGLRPMLWAEVYAGGIGGFVARLRPEAEPPPHSARHQYLAWCRDRGVPWAKEDQEYGARLGDELPVIADDADVSVIAAHTSRMAIDILVRPGASIFPHSAYVIGLAQGWIFDQPFDTRPFDFAPGGEWRQEMCSERTDEALSYIEALFEWGDDADRTGT